MGEKIYNLVMKYSTPRTGLILCGISVVVAIVVYGSIIAGIASLF